MIFGHATKSYSGVLGPRLKFAFTRSPKEIHRAAVHCKQQRRLNTLIYRESGMGSAIADELPLKRFGEIKSGGQFPAAEHDLGTIRIIVWNASRAFSPTRSVTTFAVCGNGTAYANATKADGSPRREMDNTNQSKRVLSAMGPTTLGPLNVPPELEFRSARSARTGE